MYTAFTKESTNVEGLSLNPFSPASHKYASEAKYRSVRSTQNNKSQRKQMFSKKKGTKGKREKMKNTDFRQNNVVFFPNDNQRKCQDVQSSKNGK